MDDLKLTISSLSQAQLDPQFDTKSWVLSLSVDGKVEIIEYYVCDGSIWFDATNNEELRTKYCVQQFAHTNRIKIPLMYQKLRIIVYPCITFQSEVYKPKYFDRSSLRNKHAYCGNEKEIVSIINESDIQKEAIIHEILDLRLKLMDVAVDYKEALKKFVEEANKCAKQLSGNLDLIAKKAKIVEIIIGQPTEFFKATIVDGLLSEDDQQKILNGVKETTKVVGEEVEQLCDSFKNDQICGFLRTGKNLLIVPMIKSHNPKYAVDMLSETFNNLLTKDKDHLASRACYAEENLQQSIENLETRRTLYETQIDNLILEL